MRIPLSGRVLVVDDSPDLLLLCMERLRRWGANGSGASNGSEAGELAGSKSFDVILMDWQMPFMDGLEATRQLRSRGMQVSVISLTASAMPGDREVCLAAGSNDYVTKPLDFEKLYHLVSKYLTKDSAAVGTSLAGESKRARGISELTVQYLESLTLQLANIVKMIDAGDATAVEEAAHRVKGTAGTYRLHEVACSAEQLEDAAKVNDLNGMQQAGIAMLRALGATQDPSG